jgi:hypothetical protein
MTAELLDLNYHETVRVIRETPDELEVEASWVPGGSPPRRLGLRVLGLGAR